MKYEPLLFFLDIFWFRFSIILTFRYLRSDGLVNLWQLHLTFLYFFWKSLLVAHIYYIVPTNTKKIDKFPFAYLALVSCCGKRLFVCVNADSSVSALKKYLLWKLLLLHFFKICLKGQFTTRCKKCRGFVTTGVDMKNIKCEA